MRIARFTIAAVLLVAMFTVAGCGQPTQAPQSGESVSPTSAPAGAPGKGAAQGAVGDINSTIEQEQQGVDENTNE